MITLNRMVWIIHDITFCNPGVKHKTSGLFFSKMVLYHLRSCTMQNNNCIHNARRMVVNAGLKSACSIIWGVIIINTFWANAHGYPTFAGIFWVQQNGCFLICFWILHLTFTMILKVSPCILLNLQTLCPFPFSPCGEQSADGKQFL